MKTKLYPIERQENILKLLNEKDRVSIGELKDMLGVSEVTIRKDLNTLQDKGLIERTFGGAVLDNRFTKEPSYPEKKSVNKSSKRLIAKKASLLIKDGMDIFVDAGTTTRALVEYLPQFHNINVFTYDLHIALDLLKNTDLTVFIIGGYIEGRTGCALSGDGLALLKRTKADICFIGADAMDDKYVYSSNPLKADIKRQMIENSQVRVLMCDTNKKKRLGQISFYPVSKFDHVMDEAE